MVRLMCDTIAATGRATESGFVLFGKNSDREYDEAQYLELIPAARHAPGVRVQLTYVDVLQARQTHAILISKPHWIWGAEIGANEHGLVVGNEALFSKIEASTLPGVIGMDYLRLALERASTADEGIAVITSLLREYGQSGQCGFKRELAYHNSFLLADPQGAWVLETVDRDWVAKAVDFDYAISNTMTIDANFDKSSAHVESRAIDAGVHDPKAPFDFKRAYEDPARAVSGCFRHGRAKGLLREQRGKLALGDFFRILRDHEEGEPLPGRASGPRICAHTKENPLGQTTASWVAELKPGKRVHWVTATSAPCTAVFKPVVIEAGLPERGARPAGAPDERSVWWRHERLRQLLEAADGELRNRYMIERDSQEAGFLAAIEQCPEIDGRESQVEVQRIVEDCWDVALRFENRWLGALENVRQFSFWPTPTH
jgi:secernin